MQDNVPNLNKHPCMQRAIPSSPHPTPSRTERDSLRVNKPDPALLLTLFRQLALLQVLKDKGVCDVRNLRRNKHERGEGRAHESVVGGVMVVSPLQNASRTYRP
jgi:hypothetical protein